MTVSIAKVSRIHLGEFLRRHGDQWRCEAFPEFDRVIHRQPFSVDDFLECLARYAPEVDDPVIVFIQRVSKRGTRQPRLRFENARVVDAAGLEGLVKPKGGVARRFNFAVNERDARAGKQIRIIRTQDGEVEKRNESAADPSITRITIAGFKGIGEEIALDVKPITLIFGANSAGKSSIIQALHYAREVFDEHNLDADFTDAGGASIDLGGFQNFVHQRDASQRVFLRFEMAIGRQELFPYVEMFDRISEFTCAYVEDLANRPTRASIALEIGYSAFHNKVSVRRYEVALDGVNVATIVHNPDQRTTTIVELNSRHPLLSRPRENMSVDPSADEIEAMEELHGDVDRPFLDICLEYVRELLPYTGDESIPLIDMADALPDMDRLLPLYADLNQSTNPKERQLSQEGVFDEIRLGLTQMIVGPARILRDCLRDFIYLGPIRAVPPRDFSPPKTPAPSRWASGLGAWDRLAAADDAFIGAVSHWLADDGRLNSGYRLALKRFKELDLSDPLIVRLLTGRAFDEVDADTKLDLSNLPTQTRVLLVPTDGSLELRPSDVGIGISQVVPVIVTALDGEGRMIAIEQPELHIHPRLQAEIADLFVEAVGTRGHRFLIETHSEHFLLRLQRRIRETSQGKSPEGRTLRSEDVVVYHVSREAGQTRTRRIDVDKNGEFVQPWPDDFFEIDFYERFGNDR